MPIDDQMLGKLLRLKRFEQPPPGYYDDFLKEFQQRQRAELLKRSVWSVLRDRWEAFWEQSFTLANFSYATASVAVLCIAGVLTFNMLQNPGSGVRTSVAALVQDPMAVVAYNPEPATLRNALTPQIRIPDTLLENSPATFIGNGQTPRYILDTRPASYEATFSF